MSVRLLGAVLALILFLASDTNAESAHSLLAPPLTARYEAGLYVHHIADPERRVGDEPRTVQVMVWYPAETDGRILSHRETIGFDAAARAADAGTPAARAERVSGIVQHAIDRGADAGRLEAFLDAPTRTRLGATPAAGPFPVIVYAASVSSHPYENTVLLETLARQGFVVIATPSVGIGTRAQASGRAGIENQLADIRLSLRVADTLAFADTSRLGVVGYSRGGAVGTLLTMQEPRVRVFVSLDGSEGRDMLIGAVRESTGFDLARFDRPHMHVFPEPAENFPETREIVDAAPSPDRHVVRLPQLGHGELGSTFIMLNGFARGANARRPVAQTAPAYQAMTLLVLDMMDAHLMRNGPARARLANERLRTAIPGSEIIWE